MSTRSSALREAIEALYIAITLDHPARLKGRPRSRCKRGPGNCWIPLRANWPRDVKCWSSPQSVLPAKPLKNLSPRAADSYSRAIRHVEAQKKHPTFKNEMQENFMQSIASSRRQARRAGSAVDQQFSRALVIVLLAFASLTAGPLSAQEAQTQYQFNIPASSLESALMAFSSTSRVTVSFTSDCLLYTSPSPRD